MKRKRSPKLAPVEARKKSSPQQSTHDQMSSCPLVRTVQQYGLLEAIVTCLLPDDLLALALSSKTVYNAISPRSGSLENLLGRLCCPGRGVQIRNKCHQKSTFFYAYDCHEYIPCGATNSTRTTESRPCITCKVTTCNECRIHCVYQSNYEKPYDSDELPNFSGFVLLFPSEVPILSPQHLALDHKFQESRWQNPASSHGGPYHDQGFLDVPFDDDTFGPPESVEDILNLNLGQQSLALSVSSNVPDPSPVLKAFYQVTEQRKRWLCDICMPPTLAKCCEGLQDTMCQCTLKNRFLDRWLCLRCYEAEEAAIFSAYPTHREYCACAHGSNRLICLWCYGVVCEPKPLQDIDLGREAGTTRNIL